VFTKYILIEFCLCLLVLATAPSCKQGCNDSKAYNYSKDVKQNDGSCLYCDSSRGFYSTYTSSESDNNTASLYYRQSVLNVTTDVTYSQFIGNGCKLLNNAVHPNCLFLDYNVRLRNRKNVIMVIDGDLRLNTQGLKPLFLLNNVEIPAYGEYIVHLGSACQTQSSSRPFAYLNYTNFTYK
jgi:hypothetical protein